MKKIVLIIMLVSVGLLFAEGFSINTPEGSFSMTVTEDGASASITAKSVSVESMIEDIVKQLERLEKLHKKLNKFDQKKAQKLMNDIYEKLAMLPDDGTVTINASASDNPQVSDANVSINVNVSDSGNGQVMARPKPMGRERVEMSNIDFQDWKRRIAGEDFADDQLRIVKMGAKNAWLSCNQIKMILALFDFANDKLDALRIMWPRVVDSQNSYSVIDSFEFSNDKEAAESIME